MDHIGDTITAVLTALTGWGWALYFGAGALFVGATLLIQHRKGKQHG